jgi:hypothetical protein
MMAFPTTKSFLVRGRAYVKTTGWRWNKFHDVLYTVPRSSRGATKELCLLLLLFFLLLKMTRSPKPYVCLLGKQLASLVNFVAHIIEAERSKVQTTFVHGLSFFIAIVFSWNRLGVPYLL